MAAPESAITISVGESSSDVHLTIWRKPTEPAIVRCLLGNWRRCCETRFQKTRLVPLDETVDNRAGEI